MEVTLRHRRPSEVKMATPGREMNDDPSVLAEQQPCRVHGMEVT